MKILAIDDEKLIRWSIKETLIKNNHEVDTAANFEDAVRLASVSTYNIIFSDFEIEDCDGLEALNKIRMIQPGAAIIILSAQAQKHLEPILRDVEVHSILEKPFCCDEIASVAESILSRVDSPRM